MTLSAGSFLEPIEFPCGEPPQPKSSLRSDIQFVIPHDIFIKIRLMPPRAPELATVTTISFLLRKLMARFILLVADVKDLMALA